MKLPPVPLRPHEIRFRWAAIGGALFLGLLLAVPGLGRLAFSGWPSPFHDLTGLPCPFCGMTRSGQSLLAGDLARAFYYNALGPVLALMAGIFLIAYGVELVRRTHLHWLSQLIQWLLRHVRACLLFLLVFWLLHLWMALSIPKPELIHPQGLLLRWLTVPNGPNLRLSRGIWVSPSAVAQGCGGQERRELRTIRCSQKVLTFTE